MDAEKLVLWRPRRLKFAVMVLQSMLGLAVGPIARWLVGPRYTPELGVGLLALVILCFAWLSARLAPRFGAEWVTARERMQRLQAEVASSKPWSLPVVSGVGVGMLFIGFALTQKPLAQIAQVFGGMTDFWLVLAFTSGLCATFVYFGQRIVSSGPINETAPTAQDRKIFSSGLVGFLLTIAALCVAAAAVAVQFEARDDAYFTTAGILFLCLIFISIRRMSLASFHVQHRTGLGSLMLQGLIYYGVPISMLTIGKNIALRWGRGSIDILRVLEGALPDLVTGLALGVLIYFVQWVVERRRSPASPGTEQAP